MYVVYNAIVWYTKTHVLTYLHCNQSCIIEYQQSHTGVNHDFKVNDYVSVNSDIGYTEGKISIVEGSQLYVNNKWYHIELDYVKKCEPTKKQTHEKASEKPVLSFPLFDSMNSWNSDKKQKTLDTLFNDSNNNSSTSEFKSCFISMLNEFAT